MAIHSYHSLSPDVNSLMTTQNIAILKHQIKLKKDKNKNSIHMRLPNAIAIANATEEDFKMIF